MPEDKIEMPSWFDAKLHIHNSRGVYERETGLALDGDGLPVNALIRAERERAAAEKSVAAPAEARAKSVGKDA
jgi:hypothetical protein